jgi:hypothetical protein
LGHGARHQFAGASVGRGEGVRGAARGLGFLSRVEARRALPHLQHAVVGPLVAGEDLQQRRLAAAVAPDQRDALAGILEREPAVIAGCSVITTAVFVRR